MHATLNRDVYFVFVYFDGLYYYKYGKKQKFAIKYNYCSRIGRGVREINTYKFIPMDQ